MGVVKQTFWKCSCCGNGTTRSSASGKPPAGRCTGSNPPGKPHKWVKIRED